MEVEKLSKEIKLLINAAEQGNIDACNELGELYFFGDENTDRDYELAFKYFSKAVAENPYSGHYLLGLLYKNGEGTEKDIDKAIKYLQSQIYRYIDSFDNISIQNFYKKSEDSEISHKIKSLKKTAKQGDIDAYYNLGDLYYNFDHSDQKYDDYNKLDIDIHYQIKFASSYFLEAAKKGHLEAQYRLGMLYKYNWPGQNKNITKAKEWLEKAASQGHISAKYLLGLLHYDNYEEADFYYFYDNAEKGDPVSQYFLGKLYENGKGTEKDINKAIEWFEKSANQNYDKAQTYLGILYAKGKETEKDINKSIKWFEKAANQDCTDALFNLGLLYYDNHEKLDKDFKFTFKYFYDAANCGNYWAPYYLGILYEEGKGTKKDINKAIESYKNKSGLHYYYHKSAERLGDIYYSGIDIPQDLGLAKQWYDIASSEGSKTAEEKLEKIRSFIPLKCKRIRLTLSNDLDEMTFDSKIKEMQMRTRFY